MSKRKVERVVISDVHLGTYGCHAKELLNYLKSIEPREVILNGDIIDIWNFKKRYWPKSHMKVIKELTKFISKGVPVYYITGNHDEMLRKFADFNLGSFSLINKMVIHHDNKKAWVFHGDVFDVVMKHSKWLAKLGGAGYDILILINRGVNLLLEKTGRGKYSFSKKIKSSVKSAVKHINNFEETAAEIAVLNGYDYVICGHIHQPVIKKITTNKGAIIYLNSGDWVENLTSLEYNNGKWAIYDYHDDPLFLDAPKDDKEEDLIDLKTTEVFNLLKQTIELPN